MKLVTVEQMRELEARSAQRGAPPSVLMGNAGLAVAEVIQDRLHRVDDARILVVCGPGNNGGDGLVVAHFLHEMGAAVDVLTWRRDPAPTPGKVTEPVLPELPASRTQSAPTGAVRPVVTHADASTLDFGGYNVIVDAILGTGRSRALPEDLRALLGAIAAGKRANPRQLIVAVDLPTGLDADTGAVDQACLRADITITLALPKPGLVLYPGAEYVGQLLVRDIGIPHDLAEDLPWSMITDDDVRPLLPARPARSHKGTYGRTLVVGGSYAYSGAPMLSAIAALRVGAGLAQVATARSVVPLCAPRALETTFLPLPDARAGGAIGAGAAKTVADALEPFRALLVGPGVGRDPETIAELRELFQAIRPRRAEGNVPLVIDADALFALAQWPDWPRVVGPDTIVTPHGGEMSRLLGRIVQARTTMRACKPRLLPRLHGTPSSC